MKRFWNSRKIKILLVVILLITLWAINNSYNVEMIRRKINDYSNGQSVVILEAMDLVDSNLNTLKITSPFAGYLFSPIIIVSTYNSNGGYLSYIKTIFLKSTVVLGSDFMVKTDFDLYDTDIRDENDPFDRIFRRDDKLLITISSTGNYVVERMAPDANVLLSLLKDKMFEDTFTIPSYQITEFPWKELEIKPYASNGYHGIEFIFDSEAPSKRSFHIPDILLGIHKDKIITTPESLLLFERKDKGKNWFIVS